MFKRVKHLIFNQGVSTLINLLFAPYLARAMSYEMFGTYGQAILIIDLFKSIVISGISQIIITYFDKAISSRPTIIKSLIPIILCVSIFLVICVLLLKGAIAYWFNNDILISVLAIYCLSIPFESFYNILRTILIVENKTSILVYISTITVILKAVLVVISVQYFNSLNIVFISLVSISIFQMFIGLLLIPKSYIKYGITNIKLGYKVFKSSIPVGLANLIAFLILYTDGIMISSMLSVDQYAIYRNGVIELPFISIVYTSICSGVSPEISKYISEENYEKVVYIKRKIMTHLAVIIYPFIIFIGFYYSHIIEVYLSIKYIDSGIIFAIFNLTLFVKINQHYDILIYKDKSRYMLYILGLSFLLNIALNYLLILKFGSIGAVISTVFTITSNAMAYWYFSAKQINKSLLDFIDIFTVIKVVLLSLFIGLGTLMLDNFLEQMQLFLRLTIISVLFFGLYFSLVIILKVIKIQEIKKALKLR
tara:strand:+ start:315 stop:1754 length:1440 start_codon:yes stop_codon:yes gene_type:complete